jgi:hypothetical protein
MRKFETRDDRVMKHPCLPRQLSSDKIRRKRGAKMGSVLGDKRGKCNRVSGEPERAPLGAELASQCMFMLT